MSDKDEDEDHYRRLPEWAESDAREIHRDRAPSGQQPAEASHDLLRRVGGRPSIDPDPDAAGAAPRRQVRLPRDLNTRLDDLAAEQGRSASEIMRDAIDTYMKESMHPPTTHTASIETGGMSVYSRSRTSLRADDPYLPLAFSLASSPGAYAVLAGAGISKGAGLPSAWDIGVDLVRQIAQRDRAAIAINDNNAEKWYVDNYGKPLTYSNVIEEVAYSPYERQALLRKYFESVRHTGDEDQTEAPIIPSPAHRAIAELVEAGIIRVIVTMNFDRLFEQALIERGIQPTIVATEADAEGIGPLRLAQACVIHLHGDYLNAASMRNTASELNGYSPQMDRLLRHILGDYGLIVAGWSVEHDTALRDAAKACSTKRFTMGWIEPGPITDAARQLIDTRSAIVFETTANDAFARLADQVIAIRETRARHPLTVAVAANRIKRQISQKHPAISAHDMVTEELRQLRKHPEFALDDYQDVSQFEQMLGRVIEATRVPAAAVAVLSYWGDPHTDRWWTPELERLARPTRQSGSVWLVNLSLVAASILFYASGVAAIASQNYTRLERLFALHGEPINVTGSAPLSTMLVPNHSMMGLTTTAHHDAVSSTLIEALGLGADTVDDAWQLFEILRLSTQLMTNNKVAHAVATYATADRRRAATAHVDPTAEAIAGKAKRDVLDNLANQCRPAGLHLLAADKSYTPGTAARWGSPIAERLAAEIGRETQTHPVANALQVDSESLELALRAVSRSIGQAAEKHPANWVSGFLPDQVWLDSTN